jgi:diguanylate cyclase (GGDEF)-like protein
MVNRVLFVDDEHLIRRAFTRAMAHRGFAVDLAEDGAEALALARQHRYAVVATDLVMPEMDGLTLIDELAQVQPDAAFLIVTGVPHQLPSVPGRAVIDVIVKPWDNQALASSLRRAMERHRQQRTRGAVAGSVLAIANPRRVTALSDLLPAELEITVRDIDAASSLLGERDFDVVVLDLREPSPERLRQLVALQDLAPHVPILVLGAEHDDELAIQAIHAGAQDYLAESAIDSAGLGRAISFAIERKRREHRLVYRAHFDQLTGLSNRAHLEEQLPRTLSQSRRNGSLSALLFADLDGFKAINDEHGHAVGDLLLQQVAGRLRGLVRDFETVARLGGDEFAVVLQDLVVPEDAGVVASRICEQLALPFFVGERQLRVSTSVGIASYPQDAPTAEQLVERADEAMYRAKNGGRNRYCFYSEPALSLPTAWPRPDLPQMPLSL